MDTETTLKIWNAVKEVSKEAQKSILGGRLKGMTDINPMWRYKKLTELFGAAGEGWKTTDEQFSVHDGANGEKVVFCTLRLWVRNPEDGEFGDPIHGQGGSMLVVKESQGLRTNDEAYKMAYTDAISVACKQLGFGADIYWQQGGSKYQPQEAQTAQKPQQVAQQRKNLDQQKPGSAQQSNVCADCNAPIAQAVAVGTQVRFGRALCPACAKKAASNANQ